MRVLMTTLRARNVSLFRHIFARAARSRWVGRAAGGPRRLERDEEGAAQAAAPPAHRRPEQHRGDPLHNAERHGRRDRAAPPAFKY